MVVTKHLAKALLGSICFGSCLQDAIHCGRQKSWWQGLGAAGHPGSAAWSQGWIDRCWNAGCFPLYIQARASAPGRYHSHSECRQISISPV